MRARPSVPRLALMCLLLAACGEGAGADGGLPDGGARADAGATDAGPIDAAVTDGGGLDAATDAAVTDGGAPAMGHRFGTHGGYFGDGVIFPGRPQAELDQATADRYDAWKARYLEPACAAGQYRIHTAPGTAAYTVSEGHGYAMLMAVIMAGHDPEAQPLFDGLYRYFEDHRDAHGLMSWAQNASCENVMGADSATDGDLDVAYALLLADRQWGSDGAIDYRARGSEVASAILAAEVHPTANAVLIGDWVDASDSHYDGTRPSDFMVSHFHAFAGVTSTPRWDDVRDATYAIVDALQTGHAPSTGLLPDFAVGVPSGSPRPAPGGWLEGASDGRYAYNACRVPWRIATDYLMSGEPRARDAVRRINAFIRGDTGDDPGRVVDGYRLDGGRAGGGPDLAFVGPFGVSAMVEPASGTNQPWLDAVWDFVAAAGLGQYYGDTVALLSMVVMSGNWWTP